MVGGRARICPGDVDAKALAATFKLSQQTVALSLGSGNNKTKLNVSPEFSALFTCQAGRSKHDMEVAAEEL